MAGTFPLMLSDIYFRLPIVFFFQVPECNSKTVIARIFNFFGLLSVFFGELSLWFSRWVNHMNPASIVNSDLEPIPHFPRILCVERRC